MKVHKLGDVHLGKRFENGVPLHRRGDREEMVWAQFERELNVPCDLHIQMGDLFDKFVVPYTVVWRAAQLYIAAQEAHPKTTFVVLRGNHDASRDLEKVSAFQIFKGLVEHSGVVVVDEAPYQLAGHTFFPWHPVITAAEMVTGWQGRYAYLHCDVVMGEDNALPAALLKAQGFERTYTGHDHVKRELTMEGLDVHVVGSMQPYSHAEDRDEQLYVTITLDQIGEDYTNKCVRLVLTADHQLDEPIDCLQLTIQRLTEDVEVAVDFEEFDMKALFDEAVAATEMDPDFAKVVWARLHG
jgi:DNA repair exonuclease SbcCD nuclease subunit